MTSRTAYYTSVMLAVIAFFTIADLMWLPYSTITLFPGYQYDFAVIAAVLIAIYAVAYCVARRVKGDNHKFALLITSLAASVKTLIGAWTLLTMLLISMTIFTYLASATTAPFVDSSLIGFEKALGFSWVGFVAALNAWPLLCRALVWAYFTMLPQITLLIIYLALTSRSERLMEFLALFSTTALLTCLMLAFYPSIGPQGFLHPPADIRQNFSPEAGMRHYHIVMSLRMMKPFTLKTAEGLVTFPSFHAITGILLIYAVRGMRYLFWPVLVVNAAMILATIPEGGHYLPDLIVGGLISLAMITLLVRKQRTG